MSALRTIGQMPGAQQRQYLTVVGCKKVLVVAHTVTYVQRLLDVLALLEGDFRVQVVFTAPPHVFGDEVPALLARLGCAVVPWDEALRMEFDLALAAGRLGVDHSFACTLQRHARHALVGVRRRQDQFWRYQTRNH